MKQIQRPTLSLNVICRTIATLLIAGSVFSCYGQSQQDKVTAIDTTLKVAPESLHFTAHVTEKGADGSKGEIDTITGYRKYYYSNGKLQMEGKVTKAPPKDYRDGVWKYYNENGQLINQETYAKEGKLNHLDFMYFTNGNPMKSTYEYYEGDYKDKATFKFHKIEKLFYTNGKKLAERHWVNKNLVDEKCWDSKGNPKPIEYLNTIKSLKADE